MQFFAGWHQPNNGRSGPADFEYCLISANRLTSRKASFAVKNWILDSGAFTRLENDGEHMAVEEYAAIALRFSDCGNLMAVVIQDYPCSNRVLETTGLAVHDHQRITIDRYDSLLDVLEDSNLYVMPVLQGKRPMDYVSHIHQYGDRLGARMWVGVGSLKGRHPDAAADVLKAIKAVRPDLQLHGFGASLRLLKRAGINYLLHSADSIANSFHQRKRGGNPNDPELAIAYAEEIDGAPIQHELFMPLAQHTHIDIDVMPLSRLIEFFHLHDRLVFDDLDNSSYSRYLMLWGKLISIAQQVQPELIDDIDLMDSSSNEIIQACIRAGAIADDMPGPSASVADVLDLWQYWLDWIDPSRRNEANLKLDEIRSKTVYLALAQQRWDIIKWAISS